MRFRATVAKEQLPVLYNQVKLMHDIGKVAVMTLSADCIRTCVRLEDDALQLYATLLPTGVFTEFRIESKMDNVIALELLLPNLFHALKSGLTAAATTLKLTKEGMAPFLSVVTQTVEGGVDVLQNVPVRVLAAAEMERYREPVLPHPTVRLTFPSPKPVAAVVDRMRAVSKTLRLEAYAGAGRAAFSVRSEAVAMCTTFRDLPSQAGEGDAGGGGGGGGSCTAATAGDAPTAVANLSIRHVSRALRVLATHDSTMLLCTCGARHTHLHAICTPSTHLAPSHRRRRRYRAVAGRHLAW